MLILEGVASPPARITGELQVLLAWEPLPQPYTVPQLSQTRCYSQPRYVAAALKRNRPGAQVRVTASHCLTQAQTDPQSASLTRPAQPSAESYLIPLLVRDRWDAYGPRFTLPPCSGGLAGHVWRGHLYRQPAGTDRLHVGLTGTVCRGSGRAAGSVVIIAAGRL